jgi:hypothetical protein
MNLDWAVAVSVFLIFIALGFSYYWSLFETQPGTAGDSLRFVDQKVLDYLQVDSWRVPVRYNSSSPGIAILYLDFQWPDGTRNSTRMMDSGLELDCMLQGGRVYFQANVEEGVNFFDMTFASMSSPVTCDSVLDTLNANQTTPFAMEKSRSVSQSRITQMLGSDYAQFRQSLGIARNFQVQAGTESYGPSSPPFTNTYVKETQSLVQETEQPITIRVMVW